MKPCVPIQFSMYSITSHKNFLIRGLTFRLQNNRAAENTLFLKLMLFLFSTEKPGILKLKVTEFVAQRFCIQTRASF